MNEKEKEKEKEESINNEALKEDDKIEWAKEINEEAFNVILRLYDKTIKDLVDR